MQPSGRAGKGDESEFSELEELARRTATDLLRQRWPFDIVGGGMAGDGRVTKTGLWRFLGMQGGHSRRRESFQGWRLHSMRLTETAQTATGDLGLCRNVSRKDEELWLGAKGRLFVFVFRTSTENNETSLTVSSQPLTYHSAARYDYTPAWKTKQTVQGNLRVNEAWLEILGKPRCLEPFGSVSNMLVSLTAGFRVPSGIK